MLHFNLIAKDALKLIFGNMSDRWVRCKSNKSFSSWSALLQGMPQRSVSGAILFNIYLNNQLFCVVTYTTPCVGRHNLAFILTELKEHSIIAIEWFENNHMKMNSDKCQLLISVNKFKNLWTKIGNSRIWENRTINLMYS